MTSLGNIFFAATFGLAVLGNFNAALAEGAIYVGAGAAETGDPAVSDAVPLSFGFLGFKPNGAVVGLDFGLEGTMLDSTWGRDSEVIQALSVNLILGHNISQTDSGRLDIGALIGMRSTVADCPDSYLGYQCYADTAPDVQYALNYGVVVTYSAHRALFGLRATGESLQALIGTRF